MALVKQSTRAFFEEGARVPELSRFDLIHGYLYGRWPHLYIAIATGEHPLARFIAPLFNMLSGLLGGHGIRHNGVKERRPTMADNYHGKVVPLDAARKLVTVNEDVIIGDLEKVLPYSRARDLILKNPNHLAVLECPCRSARKSPCKPLDVCLVVGEPFASFVLDHHPRKARRITAAEAVEILRAEDERGHVHHAFFKDAMLGRFYAICNCCSCCCGAMQAHRHGTPMVASSGFVNSVNVDLCIGCGKCNRYCQFGALAVCDRKNTVNQEKCMGCGVCVSKCEHGALALSRAPEKGIPLELEELMKQANTRVATRM